MSRMPEDDELPGHLKYAPPSVREKARLRDFANFLDPLLASDGEEQEIVSMSVREGSDFDVASEGPEFDHFTGLQSFATGGSDKFSQGDLGLSSLISDIAATRISIERKRTYTVPVEKLRPNSLTPRRRELEDNLDELAASIRERGVLQPIIVRGIHGVANEYEIIAGERRWRAAQRAGLDEVPVILREVNDLESFELAIVENVQRTNLSPLEQASAYQVLIDQYGYAQDEVAKIIGKSRSSVANTLRLLELPESVKRLLQSGKLTAGHARTLVGLPNAEELAEEIVALELNVRQVEERAQSTRPAVKKTKRSVRPEINARLTVLQKRLSDLVGLSVNIDHRGYHGMIRIRYAQLEQLERLADQLEAVQRDAQL